MSGMSYRRLMNIVLMVVVVGVMGSAWSAVGEVKVSGSRPNVIFIMADDLGYGDLGCYGQQVIKTPEIDKLAGGGMKFTNVYAGSPVCAPSRSVLMTGMHTGHTTVRGNMGRGGVKGLGGANGRVPLRAEDVTVAEVLKSAGYVTGMTGKWGLGEPGTSGEPNKQGFDEWFGYLNQRKAHSYYPDFIWLNDKKFVLPGNANGKKGQYTHDMFTEFALKFLDKHGKGEKPFFLYLPYTVPHAKYEIPDVGIYADKKWSDKEKVHAAMITRLDGDVGKIMAKLKALGLDEKTVVFFCSDNGAAERWEGRFDSSGKLRGRKRDVYEGGLRTPMIVRWPGVVPAGKVSDAAWYFADVLPTLADLAGENVPKGVDGVSVLEAIVKGTQKGLADRVMYWEFHERGFYQAARWGKWKGVRLKKDGPIAVYDLSKDIGEKNDVTVSQGVESEVEAVFKRYFKNERTESKEWPLK